MKLREGRIVGQSDRSRQPLARAAGGGDRDGGGWRKGARGGQRGPGLGPGHALPTV